jgi:hypothetical protein
MRLPFLLLFVLLPLAAGTVRAEENLITNPGFETGVSPWTENNWLHNEVTYGLDSDTPHSGKHSFKMDFTRTVGGGSTSFYYPQLPIRPSQIVQVRFWARGTSNGAPLYVRIRKGAEPWTTYFQAESLLTEQWQELVYTVSLPGQVDPDKSQLLFYLIQPGTIWLDDVSVTEMPAVEAGEAPTANPVRNGSFEVGREGWTATIRRREFKTLWEESGSNYPSPDNAELVITETDDAPEGRRHLSLTIDPGSRAFLTSGYFPARYGHPMHLTFSLQSDAPHPFQVAVSSGKNANYRLAGKTALTSSVQWQQFSIPVTLTPSPQGVYNIEFQFDEPGHYALDAVTLAEDTHPLTAPFPQATAIVATPDAPAGHLYDHGQAATFLLRVAKAAPRTPAQFEVRTVDFLGWETDRQTVTVPLDADGYGETPFTVSTNQYGAFKIEARPLPAPEPGGFIHWVKGLFRSEKEPTAPALLAEQIYSVLPALADPAERPDSFFGGHVDLTPYNLEIARKAGFRWLRLYPPLSTQWMAVEPSPGEWRFETQRVERASDLGFHILANLGTCPDFAADIDPRANAQEKSRWRRSFIPANLERWQDYISRTVEAFEPYVEAWEIWNEPDGDYMRFRPELDRATVYLSLLKAANEALDADDIPAVIVGPAISSINDKLAWELLNMGAGRYLDAFSFHHYAMAAGGSNPDVPFLLSVLKRYETFTNRDGQPLPLWHTEGGPYINGSQSWLDTYRVPPSSTITPPQAAAAIVRTSAFFKAAGVQRYFDYQVGASPAGRRLREDITDGFIDVTGIPGPGIAAHAAMVDQIETLAPRGVDTLDCEGATVMVARFAGDGQRVDVYWSDHDIPLAKALGDDRPDQILDMMGNPLPLAEATLSEFPLYVRYAPRP